MAEALGYSRQYFYKLSKEHATLELTKQMVIDMVQKIRKQLPQLGTRKLHYMIKDELTSKQIKVGRDKLFSWLKEYDMLIHPKKRYVQTTNSKHWMKKYPNLIKKYLITEPEQVWVSDITYIKTEEGNCYLNLITDACSRKIMGYAIADNMETESMITALHMALKNKKDKLKSTIHHSDRGLQYCSALYVETATKNNMIMSMTENGDPYENALAERMNRTMKDEFGLGEVIKNKEIAKILAKEAVILYNNQRPHLSLQMKTPQQIHKKSRQLEAVGII